MRMKIGVLTSSRADYGIYLPLLKTMIKDDFFNLELIAFGTHLSINHGYTLNYIIKDGFKKIHEISSLISNDDEVSIATSYALTALKFADFWQINKYDLVFGLGDRYEMSAAIQAGIPFGVKFAHIHGGETTLGAIDNIYRHQISLVSKLHFASTKQYTEKVIQLIGTSENVYTVGSLSLDGIENFKPCKKDLFFKKYGILNYDFALITFHPETIDTKSNKLYAIEMRKALTCISKLLFLVITMPNADTMGSIYRQEIEKLQKDFPNKIVCIENFGKENYFNAMFYAKMLIGNTSSGILEAASFGKYVVNVGNRQLGRAQSENCINIKFLNKEIVDAVQKVCEMGEFNGQNIYHKKNSSKLIINCIKSFHEIV